MSKLNIFSSIVILSTISVASFSVAAPTAQTADAKIAVTEPGTPTPVTPGDDGTPDTVNSEIVGGCYTDSLAYELGYTEFEGNVGPQKAAADPCINQWNAVILAKDNWNKTVIGSALVGWLLPPVAAGIVLQKTSALSDARKLMTQCCAIPGNAKEWSCKEAVTLNYLK